MRRIGIPFLLLAIALLLIHIFLTDPLRHTPPLQLKFVGFGNNFSGASAEQTAEITKAKEAAVKNASDATLSANRYRLASGITKWVCGGCDVSGSQRLRIPKESDS
jgi:hypothetical protein